MSRLIDIDDDRNCYIEMDGEYEKWNIDPNVIADAQSEPKTGKWILDGHHVRCDQCGVYMCNTDREGDPIPRFFCPNCGADMKG